MKAKIFDLWPEGNPLKIINGNDKQVDEYLNKIGLGNMKTTTVTDATKLKIRQDGIKLFMENRKFSDYIQNDKLPSYDFFGKDFFLVFGENSPFNEKVGVMLKNFNIAAANSESGYETEKYRDLSNLMIIEFSENLKREGYLNSMLTEEFKDVFSYNGYIEITSDLENKISKVTHQTFGFQQYAFYKYQNLIFKYAEKIKSFWDESLGKGFGNFLISVIRKLIAFIFILPALAVWEYKEKYATDSLYTEEIPEKVKNSLIHLNQKILAVIKNKLIEGLSQKLPDFRYNFKRQSVYCNQVKIVTKLQFSLRPDTGFNVRLVTLKGSQNIILEENRYTKYDAFKVDNSHFEKGTSFYSKMKGGQLLKRSNELLTNLQNEYLSFHLKEALDTGIAYQKLLLENKDFLLESGVSYLDILNEIKYSNIESAIKGLGMEEEWGEILNFRTKIKSLWEELSEINAKAIAIKNALASVYRLDWCFPDFVSDEKNIISFDKLIPIHLIGQNNQKRDGLIDVKDLRPINNLPPLNGKIISITGQNGGGKTALEVALINAIIISHMGYPVFAKYFQLNTKDILATVFVEKGEGSMLQLLMEKMKVVAETVKTHDHKKIVIIMDELLTGTQESSGLDIGRRFLHLLAENKCSVMFVTQITDLARYAEIDLGALSFHFDKDGILLKGIGSGNAEILAEKVGLMQHLN